MTEARNGVAWLHASCLAVVLALCIVASPPVRAAGDEAPVRALRQTLDRHLAAINARDLDALLSTVTGGEALTTILPDGSVLATREEYRRLHVDWFEDPDWRMVFEVQDVRVLGDTGIARVRYDAQARDASGAYASRRKAILTLLFAREPGGWRLVHDQNTVIPSETQ